MIKRSGSVGVLALGSLILAACGAATGDEAGTRDLSIATWGGDIQSTYDSHAVPAYEEEYGGEILFTPTDADTAMARVQAERDGTSTFDIISILEPQMVQLKSEELLETIDETKIPNLENVDERFQLEHAVTNFYSTRAIMYNADEIEDPPTSWSDVWDPKYKGRVGVQTGHYVDWLFAAAASIKGAPPETDEDWEAGWPLIEELADHARIYGTTPTQEMQSGELWILYSSPSAAKKYTEDSSINFEAVIPEEGSWAKLDLSAIPANAPNADDAYDFLNVLLEPESQRAIYETAYYIPGTTNAGLTQQEFEEVAGTPEEQARTITLDFDYIEEHDAEWRERWQDIIQE